tara:strand:- start:347 stop:583 length:237 start_codon:yes stop_codon:yes gene_type:complete
MENIEIESLKELKGQWRLFINGMQQTGMKDYFTYIEMIEFINHENTTIINSSCEFMVRFSKSTTEFEFRNNHWARENI